MKQTKTHTTGSRKAIPFHTLLQLTQRFVQHKPCRGTDLRACWAVARGEDALVLGAPTRSLSMPTSTRHRRYNIVNAKQTAFYALTKQRRASPSI